MNDDFAKGSAALVIAAIMFELGKALGTATIAAGTTYAAYSLSSATSYVSRKLQPQSNLDKALRIASNAKEACVIVAGVASAIVLVDAIIRYGPQEEEDKKDRRKKGSVGYTLRKEAVHEVESGSENGRADSSGESNLYCIGNSGVSGNDVCNELGVKKDAKETARVA